MTSFFKAEPRTPEVHSSETRSETATQGSSSTRKMTSNKEVVPDTGSMMNAPGLSRDDVRADFQTEFSTFMADLRQELSEWATMVQRSTSKELHTLESHFIRPPEPHSPKLRESADPGIHSSMKIRTLPPRTMGDCDESGLVRLESFSRGISESTESAQWCLGHAAQFPGLDTIASESSAPSSLVGPEPPPTLPGIASRLDNMQMEESQQMSLDNTCTVKSDAETFESTPSGKDWDQRPSTAMSPPAGRRVPFSSMSSAKKADSWKSDMLLIAERRERGNSEDTENSWTTERSGNSRPASRPSQRMMIAPHRRSSKVQSSGKVQHMPSTFVNVHHRVLSIVNGGIFDIVVASAILLNGLVVGCQTDYMARHMSSEAPFAFEVLEYIFCVLFTAELGLRLYAYRLHFFTSSTGVGWNIFDFVVVTLQLLEIIMTFVASGLGFSFNLLRTLRLVRVIRLARTLRLIGELRTIVSSIASSMKPLLWTGVLLLMIVYVLSVYVTQVVFHERLRRYDNHEEIPPDLEQYWGSLVPSMYSLFQSITGGLDWDMIARPLIDNIGPEVGVLFTLYIMFTVFAMLNVVTGVFIQNVIKNEAAERESSTMRHVQELFRRLDVGSADQITWDQFEEQLNSKAMREFFKTIDVDIGHAQDLFELLDVDNSGTIDATEFMDGCLRIWTPAKGMDLKMIMRDINQVKGLVMDHGDQLFRKGESRPSRSKEVRSLQNSKLSMAELAIQSSLSLKEAHT